MKNLKNLSEIETRYGTRNINELEFDSPEEFAAYKKKHKLRKGTVVKVAGKDKKIGDDSVKGKRMQITMDFQMANREDLEKYAKKYNLKLRNTRSHKRRHFGRVQEDHSVECFV